MPSIEDKQRRRDKLKGRRDRLAEIKIRRVNELPSWPLPDSCRTDEALFFREDGKRVPCLLWLPFVPVSLKRSQKVTTVSGRSRIAFSTEAQQEIRWLRKTFFPAVLPAPWDDERGQYRFDFAVYRTSPKTKTARSPHENPRRGDSVNQPHLVLDAISRRKVPRAEVAKAQRFEEPGWIWADDHQVTEGGWEEFFGAPRAGFAARIQLRDWDGYGWNEAGLYGGER